MDFKCIALIERLTRFDANLPTGAPIKKYRHCRKKIRVRKHRTDHIAVKYCLWTDEKLLKDLVSQLAR